MMQDLHATDNFKEFIEWYQQKEEGNYTKPSLTVDNIIFSYFDNALHLMMIKRLFHPFKDCYCLPGGFVDYNESCESACLRELKEETGVKLNEKQIEQLHLFSQPNRDLRTWVMSTTYLAYLDQKPNLKAGDDAADVAWFKVKIQDYQLYLSNDELALEYVIDLSKEKDEFYVDLKHNYQTMLDNKKFDQATIAFDHVYMLKLACDKIITSLKFEPKILNVIKNDFSYDKAFFLYQDLGITYQSSEEFLVKNQLIIDNYFNLIK